MHLQKPRDDNYFQIFYGNHQTVRIAAAATWAHPSGKHYLVHFFLGCFHSTGFLSDKLGLKMPRLLQRGRSKQLHLPHQVSCLHVQHNHVLVLFQRIWTTMALIFTEFKCYALHPKTCKEASQSSYPGYCAFPTQVISLDYWLNFHH